MLTTGKPLRDAGGRVANTSCRFGDWPPFNFCTAGDRCLRCALSTERQRWPMKFDLGAVVQLPSGGPLMTVCNVPDQNHVECYWFIDGKLDHHKFPADALVTGKKTDGGQAATPPP